MSQIMSAELVSIAGGRRTVERDFAQTDVRTLRLTNSWDLERYAQEQIRTLVQRVFFTPRDKRISQVVFATVDSGTEIGSICRRVVDVLAMDSGMDVAIVPSAAEEEQGAFGIVQDSSDLLVPLRQVATQLGSHLWRLPRISATSEDMHALWRRYLAEIRNQFRYSVVEAPGAGESSEPSFLGQVADGLILVLSAQRTRRAAARKVKEHLEAAHVQVLGAVLSDREFPIPEPIYRRL